jgi:hypothetical protein
MEGGMPGQATLAQIRSGSWFARSAAATPLSNAAGKAKRSPPQSWAGRVMICVPAAWCSLGRR